MNKHLLFISFLLAAPNLSAELVNFNIQKLADNDYKIAITPTQTLFAKANLTTSLSNLVSNKKIDFQYSKDISGKEQLKSLDAHIRKTIIDSIIRDTRGKEQYKSTSTVNVTVELNGLTTFNKVYRDLYNTIRLLDTSLPNLAPEARIASKVFQQHPRITGATITGTGFLGLYTLWKAKQTLSQ